MVKNVMLYEVNGDLIEDSKYDVFCHQTNCQGVMGAGIALQIKIMYPEVAIEDRAYFRKYKDKEAEWSSNTKMLGTNLYVKTHDGRTCVNMYAQFHYRNDGTRKTDYDAFRKCIIRLQNKLLLSDPGLRVGFPYGIGCGLGGGDWAVIYDMIKTLSTIVKQDVFIVRKTGFFHHRF